MNTPRLFAVAALLVVSPALAAGQGTGVRVSILGSAGSHIGDGGDTQAVGVGVWFGERFGAVVSAERSHVPFDVTYFADGYSTTRGAMTRFISGEFRYIPVTFKGVSPYVIAAIGHGVSRPNVNAFFPNPVTHTVVLRGPGFGARVRMTEHLSAFGDLRFLFQSRRGEPDAGGFGPIRIGLAWRF